MQNLKLNKYATEHTTFQLYLRNILFYLYLPFILVFLYFKQLGKPTAPDSLTQMVNANPPMWKTNLFNTCIDLAGDKNANDGKTHHKLTQTILHGVYLYNKYKNKVAVELSDENGLSKSIHTSGHISTGYGYNEHGQFSFSTKSTGLDTLAAVNLAMVHMPNEALLDKYDQLVVAIINNDFSLLEAEEPDLDEVKEFWKNSRGGIKYKVKSHNAIMTPRWGTTPEEALVLLTTLQTNYKKNKNPYCLEIYNKLYYKFGYGVLSKLADKTKLETQISLLVLKELESNHNT